MILKKFLLTIKKNKLPYYTVNYVRKLIPNILYQKSLRKKILSSDEYDTDYLTSRLNYYNKLSGQKEVRESAVSLDEMNKVKGHSSYYFDAYQYTRYFRNSLKANFIFTDVIHVPDVPTLQKSRPVAGNNENAVVLKMDKRRHFLFVKDPYSFSEKKDMLIGRGSVNAPNSPQPHRMRFMEMYFGHPLCDLGQVNKAGGNPQWLRPKISIIDHLKFKFILSLEGNDVATNLKWIMSSNSVAVMPEPKYETWFMEGTLIPDFHFIRIKEDYSDLEERLRYYIDHPAEAQKITANANAYVRQFWDDKVEDLLSILVLQKYFESTGQLEDRELIKTKLYAI
ncbi:glycosyl transferase family 90 [Dyadobacter subterraneus]|uniref:Lipopolysaccharide biosynthesis protein n=1 Tax=Dyadobacter subterraneus TaxID=2773304 RepID=A0ABR9WDU0_9BACT|nr:glycosyl transferase family 90 [Dyadobacter subterraneus]MBE9463643.1 lipopolysaccharide biosynthesis protein [Dyadobacter subterraneus]